MRGDQVLVRAEGALCRRTLKGVLVIAPDASEPVLVTTPGDVAWELLAEAHTPVELAAALGELFDTEPATVARDIEPVIESLLASGALVERLE